MHWTPQIADQFSLTYQRLKKCSHAKDADWWQWTSGSAHGAHEALWRKTTETHPSLEDEVHGLIVWVVAEGVRDAFAVVEKQNCRAGNWSIALFLPGLFCDSKPGHNSDLCTVNRQASRNEAPVKGRLTDKGQTNYCWFAGAGLRNQTKMSPPTQLHSPPQLPVYSIWGDSQNVVWHASACCIPTRPSAATWDLHSGQGQAATAGVPSRTELLLSLTSSLFSPIRQNHRAVVTLDWIPVAVRHYRQRVDLRSCFWPVKWIFSYPVGRGQKAQATRPWRQLLCCFRLKLENSNRRCLDLATRRQCGRTRVRITKWVFGRQFFHGKLSTVAWFIAAALSCAWGQ